MNKTHLLSIKDFAILCRTTPRTIRFYDLQGLLKPAFIDPFTKYRYYNPLQGREFFKIKLLQDFHVPLKQIHEVMPVATEYSFLETQIETLKKEIEEREREYKFLQEVKSFLFSGKPGINFLHTEEWGPYMLLAKHFPDGRYDRINSDIQEIIDMAKKLKIATEKKAMVFYLDLEAYKPRDMRMDIGVVMKLKSSSLRANEMSAAISEIASSHSAPRNDGLPPGYFFKEFPKQKLRVYTYKGPYEYITLVYQKIYEQPEFRPLKPHELGVDLQVNGPWWDTKSPYDYITKIAFPLKK